MATAFRVAVIGQGFMGRAHSLGWARAAVAGDGPLRPELSVLCGRDRGALEANARRYGFADWNDDWSQVVRRDDVDLVDICTPGASHAPIALAALGARKHVLCEKPLANTLDEARVLARAAEEAAVRGAFACVGFNYRRVPAMAVARRLVEEGRVGELRQVRAAYLQDWLVDRDFPLTWRLDSGQAGSGALGDLLAHVVDLVRFVSGDEFSEVVSVLETFVKERPRASNEVGLSGAGALSGGSPAAKGPVSVDDACAALGRLGRGAMVTMEATRMALGRKNSLVLELYGSAGSLAFDLERLNELVVYEAGASPEGFSRVLVTGPDDPYMRQWWPPGHVLGWEHSFVHEFEDLMAAIAERRQPEPSFADGLATQAVLDAVSRSARTRAWERAGTKGVGK
ncbi:MAG: Gfo/Idh/MocA family protein [Acidimicrobiales bacterium]